MNEEKSEVDIHKHLLSLLFGEPELPDTEKPLNEEWYVNVKRMSFLTEVTVFRLIF